MPSPEKVSPSPRLSFSTSFENDRSAMAAPSWRIQTSEIVLADVAQHLLQRGDQGTVFLLADAVEHPLEAGMHPRPGAGKLRTALVGEEYLAHAAVGLAELAPHQPLGLQRIQRAAERRLLDDRIDGERADRQPVADRQHGERPHLGGCEVVLAQV